MSIVFERARAPVRRESPPSVTCLDLLLPDGSIDLTNPLVRLMPISTLALAVAEEATRKKSAACAIPRAPELVASLEGEIGVTEEPWRASCAIEGETQ